MRYLIILLCILCLGGCKPYQESLIQKYKDEGYEIENICTAMPGDFYESYTLINKFTQDRVSIGPNDAGKIVVTKQPTNKDFQDFWWWNITVGKEHNLNFDEWRKSDLYEKMLDKKAREYIMSHLEWQHPAGGVCSCRLKSVKELLREGRTEWREEYEY